MDLSLMSILFSSEVKNAGFVGAQIVFDPQGNNAIAMVEAPDGDFERLAKAIGHSLSANKGKGDFDQMYEMFARIVLEGAKHRPDRMLRLTELIKELYQF